MPKSKYTSKNGHHIALDHIESFDHINNYFPKASLWRTNSKGTIMSRKHTFTPTQTYNRYAVLDSDHSDDTSINYLPDALYQGGSNTKSGRTIHSNANVTEQTNNYLPAVLHQGGSKTKSGRIIQSNANVTDHTLQEDSYTHKPNLIFKNGGTRWNNHTDTSHLELNTINRYSSDLIIQSNANVIDDDDDDDDDDIMPPTRSLRKTCWDISPRSHK